MVGVNSSAPQSRPTSHKSGVVVQYSSLDYLHLCSGWSSNWAAYGVLVMSWENATGYQKGASACQSVGVKVQLRGKSMVEGWDDTSAWDMA